MIEGLCYFNNEGLSDITSLLFSELLAVYHKKSMEICLRIYVYDGDYYHGKYITNTQGLATYDPIKWDKKQGKRVGLKKRVVKLDCAFVHYLISEICISTFYRLHFINRWTDALYKSLVIILKSTECDLIDYNWNERVYDMVREKCELDHALSWLSTLGGAFSALGDYFPSCAEIAGKISINQFKLALRLGDPTIAARCRLFLALSLIQKKRFHLARRIIYSEFQKARNSVVVDNKLLNMCRGIWAKLQYEYKVYSESKYRIKNVLADKITYNLNK
ncbi:unnamed protein product [Callosobruchus maculatus]|uniref:Uncharacterized protein n=1 Tax=Callosobruchus maculatus TaxID=64391 RepID=A0A653CQ78_CALMS|nr:unnamed protein product [Callosobruchus maculatus]